MSPVNAVYLDNSATTKVCSEAMQKIVEAMTVKYGNPSSLHAMGIESEALLFGAREQIAETLGCETNEIYFTSGGTESNNLALFGAANAMKRRGNRIITTQAEHSSIIETLKQLEKDGFEIIRLKPGLNGVVAEENLFAAITPETILISMMLVNNETGVISPVGAIKKAVQRAGASALIHCDAVQAYCRLPLSPDKLGADLLSFSAHKIHGPKGVGALYIRKGVRITPMFYGGSQEKTLRPGTEAIPLICGFAQAAKTAHEGMSGFDAHMKTLKDYCIEQFKSLTGVYINSPDNAAPHILNISIEGIRSEIMLNYLSSKKIYISSGSACGRGAKSHVLTSMGLSPRRIDSALRISFCRFNTTNDVERLVEEIINGSAAIQRLK